MNIKNIVKLFSMFINFRQINLNVSIFVTSPYFLFYPVSLKTSLNYLLYEDFLQIMCVYAYTRTV